MLSDRHRLLEDLLRHQEWADSEMWRTILACEAAASDGSLRDRLHHIHLAQHAFLSIVLGEEIVETRPADFPTLADLRGYAVLYHRRMMETLGALSDERLARVLTLPWFKEPPIRVTAAEALAQAAMHSHSHRGQNAARLRELGAEPPTTDLIMWYWKGRPTPAWD